MPQVSSMILFMNSVLEWSCMQLASILETTSTCISHTLVLNYLNTLHVLWDMAVCTKPSWFMKHFQDKSVTSQCHQNLNWMRRKVCYDLVNPSKSFLLHKTESCIFIPSSVN